MLAGKLRALPPAPARRRVVGRAEHPGPPAPFLGKQANAEEGVAMVDSPIPRPASETEAASSIP
eukprot:9392456-Pyramimonas_sp.AAC.1